MRKSPMTGGIPRNRFLGIPPVMGLFLMMFAVSS